jgi:hypothetical protein
MLFSFPGNMAPKIPFDTSTQRDKTWPMRLGGKGKLEVEYKLPGQRSIPNPSPPPPKPPIMWSRKLPYRWLGQMSIPKPNTKPRVPPLRPAINPLTLQIIFGPSSGTSWCSSALPTEASRASCTESPFVAEVWSLQVHC